MKQCFKCKETKPLDQFYAHLGMADGHLNKCKTCAKADTAERESRKKQDFHWYEKELERHRVKAAKRRMLGIKSGREAAGKKAWDARNRIKKQSHQKVRRAIQSGKLTRKPCCICGDLKAEAHHDDYSKPLDVRWLCKKHHAETHVKINAERRRLRFGIPAHTRT